MAVVVVVERTTGGMSGGGGIRTHERAIPLHAFEVCDHPFVAVRQRRATLSRELAGRRRTLVDHRE
jgi:hypothetical protein